MDANIKVFIGSCKTAWLEFIFDLMKFFFVKLKDPYGLSQYLYYNIIEQMASEQSLCIEVEVYFLHIGDLQAFIGLVDKSL